MLLVVKKVSESEISMIFFDKGSYEEPFSLATTVTVINDQVPF